MRIRRFGTVLTAALVLALAAAPEAKSVGAKASPDEMALHEMLEGKSGRREAWASAPSLVIVSSVLDYEHGDMSTGFPAIDQSMNDEDVAQLKNDLTAAMNELTGGAFKNFRAVTVESARAGNAVKMVRPGQIVVARFRGVQKATGNLGYGGRLAHDSTIVGGAVMLDAAFDRSSDQRQLLRTHELGHALGFNHVESRPSVMNARVGSSITEFDRLAIRTAFDTNAQR
jgi:hypothetical protein